MGAKPSGYNEMRWDCQKDGCFNIKRRPKIEQFTDCFPGKINFGDMDGHVELCGFFCMLEWKGKGGELKTGQVITFEQYTRINGNVVFVVEGDADTMTVRRFCRYWRGARTAWIVGDLNDVKAAIKSWSNWAMSSRSVWPDAPKRNGHVADQQQRAPVVVAAPGNGDADLSAFDDWLRGR